MEVWRLGDLVGDLVCRPVGALLNLLNLLHLLHAAGKTKEAQGLGTLVRCNAPNGEVPRPLRSFASSRRRDAPQTLRGSTQNPKGFGANP